MKQTVLGLSWELMLNLEGQLKSCFINHYILIAISTL
jgi:hypothetical protein